MRKEIYTFELDTAVHARLIAESKLEGRSAQHLAEQAIRAYLVAKGLDRKSLKVSNLEPPHP